MVRAEGGGGGGAGALGVRASAVAAVSAPRAMCMPTLPTYAYAASTPRPPPCLSPSPPPCRRRMYAFDVHCNAYFPMFLLLYVLQLLLCPLLLLRSRLAAALSCALYASGMSYYFYVTFLGFASLPFLERTEVLLYPIGAIAAALPFALLAGFNPTKLVLRIYFGYAG